MLHVQHKPRVRFKTEKISNIYESQVIQGHAV